MTAATESVFVYGTLRRGGSNHFRMADAGFVAAGTVRGRLYRIDWYPGLILDDDAGAIVGEIYQVSPERLKSLDRFEGPDYRRVRVTVYCTDGESSTVNAWIWEWLGATDESARLPAGDWLAATDSL